jgi:hypothetical protein
VLQANIPVATMVSTAVGVVSASSLVGLSSSISPTLVPAPVTKARGGSAKAGTAPKPSATAPAVGSEGAGPAVALPARKKKKRGGKKKAKPARDNLEQPPPLAAADAPAARKSTTIELVRAAAEVASRPVSMDPGSILRIPFTIQSSRASELLEKAFPGYSVAIGRVASSTFSALYCGAVQVAAKDSKFDFFYRTCPSVAGGGVWSSGPNRGGFGEISWGTPPSIGSAVPSLLSQHGWVGPKSSCHDSPLDCVHCGITPVDKSMLFGLSPRPETYAPHVIAPWVKRFGRVSTIVPNPAFAHFASIKTAQGRTYGCPGDCQPIVIPTAYWYDSERSYSVLPGKGMFGRPMERLVWKRTPLGGAFILVTFAIEDLATTFIAGSLFSPHPEEKMVDDVKFDDFEGGVARSAVVDRVEAAMAGKVLNSETFTLAHRTAARVVSEAPPSAEVRVGDEAKAAAEIFWAKTAKRNVAWTALATWVEVFWGRPGSAHSYDYEWRTPVLLMIIATALAYRVGWGRFSRLANLMSTRLTTAAVGASGLFAPQGTLDETMVRIEFQRKLFVIVFGPLAEEWIKRRFGLSATVAIILFELIRAMRHDGLWVGLWFYYPTALVHVVASRLPLLDGFVVHSFYNAFVIWRQGHTGIDSSVVRAALTEHYYTAALPWSLMPFLGGDGGPVTADESQGLASTTWANMRRDMLDDLPAVCCQEYAAGSLVPISVDQLNAKPPTLAVAPCHYHTDQQVGCYLVSLGLAGVIPLVLKNCAHNEGVALRERLGCDVLWGNPIVTGEWVEVQRIWRSSAVWARFSANAGDIGKIRPTCFLTWLRGYPAGQRRMLQRAAAQSENGFDGRDFTLDAFVKVEKTAILRSAMPLHKRPRLIQGRHPAVTSTCGPTMNALGKALTKTFVDQLSEVATYAGGMNAEEVGSWYSDNVAAGRVPFSFDVRFWDASVGPGPTRAWQADVLALGPNRQVRLLLQSRDSPKVGRTKHGWRYKLLFEVCSGDPDTTVGNSISHMKMWLALYYDVNGTTSPYSPGERIHDFRVLVAGDNSIAMVEESQLGAFITMAITKFRLCGFTLQAETPLRGVHQGIFCSGRLWQVSPLDFVYGPKIGRVLGKTFYRLGGHHSEKSDLRWLRGVALGLENSTRFIPILRTVISGIIRDTLGYRAFPKAEKEEPWMVHASRYHSTSPETWAQFCALYSCTVDDALAVEAFLTSLDYSSGCMVVEVDLLERIAAVDLA